MESALTLPQFENLLKGRPVSNLVKFLREDPDLYVKLTIFDIHSGTIDDDIIAVGKILRGENDGIDPQKLQIYQGAMGTIVGMALGDSMGHRFEFMPFKYEGNPKNFLTDMGQGPGGSFKLQPGQ